MKPQNSDSNVKFINQPGVSSDGDNLFTDSGSRNKTSYWTSGVFTNWLINKLMAANAAMAKNRTDITILANS